MKKISEKAFISKHAVVTGDVEIADNVSVWPMAVIRADVEKITVGENSNIQDGAVLHPDINTPVIIGKNVTIGHNAIVHGCKIGDNCLIGMGAIILSGAVVEDNSIVSAGAIVTMGKTVPSGKIVMGAPAKPFRDLTEKDMEHIKFNAEDYIRLAFDVKDKKEDFV